MNSKLEFSRTVLSDIGEEDMSREEETVEAELDMKIIELQR